MLGYAEQGEARPTHTDNGIEIKCFANHDDGIEIVEIAGLPANEYSTVIIEREQYIFHSIDEYSGNFVFRKASYVSRSLIFPPSPATPNGYDDGFGVEA